MFFVIVLLLSPWTWRLVLENILISGFLFITSFLFYKSLKGRDSRLVFFFLAILLIVQYKTTDKQSLTELDTSQKLVQQQRLQNYPPTFYEVFDYHVWFHPAKWFEENKFVVSIDRIQQNFSEVVDPGLYFFASHPRQRVGFDEFEKFPYIFLPFLVAGAVTVRKGFKPHGILFIILPILLISMIGNRNQYGPISLFPFMVAATAIGLSTFVKRFAKSKSRRIFLIVLLVLVFIQVMSYEYS